MAAPHVAGLVALLISAQPALRGQVSEIETIIEQTALHKSWTDCSSSGVPNNTYGWGRIDALAAVVSIHRLDLLKKASDSSVMPGDLITYTLSITHSLSLTSTTNVVLTDTLPIGATFISSSLAYTRVGDTIRWEFPNLDPLSTIHVDLVVRVDNTSSEALKNEDYAVQSDQAAWVRGEPISTLLGRSYFLPVAVKSP
jgi:uncharacterized repeat protein (TIGR01451 family)